MKLRHHKEGIAYITSKRHLAKAIETYMIEPEPMINVDDWINAPYRILPNVIESFKAKKDKVKLPEYEIARKVGISSALE